MGNKTVMEEKVKSPSYEEVIAYDADILYKEPVCNCPGLNCLAIMSTFH